MKTISGAARSIVCRAGLAAAAVLALSAATQQRAEALSLASPGTVPSAKYASEALTIEVRHGGGGGFRGGGMAFRGGGFRHGGFVHRGGGFRAGHIYRGGGFRYGGFRHAYHRPYFHRHRHFHRRFYHRPYYSSFYYGYPRRCRIVWTYWGPRRICRPWYRHHYYWGSPYRTYW